MKRILLLGFLAAFCIGCGYQDPKETGSKNGTYRVEMFSGGEKVGEWTTNHRPYSWQNGDVQFVPSESTREVRLRGDISITQIN